MTGLKKATETDLAARRTWGENIRQLRRCASGECVERTFPGGKAARRWQIALSGARKRLADKGERLLVLIVRDGCRVTVGPDRAALVKPGKAAKP